MMESFWKNKKVFVTGHTGFKGSWLCLWLSQLGAKITGYALSPTTPSLFDSANIVTCLEKNIINNINDYTSLQQAIQQSQPEIVFHLAAQSLVQNSYQNPVENYQTNVMGTVNLLEAVRQTDGVRVVINITSDKCYENKEWVWGYRETDRLGGHDPYSNSKACAELITHAYRDSFFNQQNIALASCRAGNVIGGGDWAENRLVPDMMRGFLSGEEIIIRNPKAIRPWQHVLEPLSGYLLLAEKIYTDKTLAQAWNFGPEEKDVQPVSFITDHLSHHWPSHQIHIGNNDKFGHEAGILKLDISKAKNVLQWKPKLNLQQALDLTAQWYKAYGAKKEMKKFTLAQINQYRGI
jgi:CDP-glucose 4,6-dehydratase